MQSRNRDARHERITVQIHEKYTLITLVRIHVLLSRRFYQAVNIFVVNGLYVKVSFGLPSHDKIKRSDRHHVFGSSKDTLLQFCQRSSL